MPHVHGDPLLVEGLATECHTHVRTHARTHAHTHSKHIHLHTSHTTYTCMFPTLPVPPCPSTTRGDLHWPSVQLGAVVTVSCSGGTASRMCQWNGRWGIADTSDCLSEVRSVCPKCVYDLMEAHSCVGRFKQEVIKR